MPYRPSVHLEPLWPFLQLPGSSIASVEYTPRRSYASLSPFITLLSSMMAIGIKYQYLRRGVH